MIIPVQPLYCWATVFPSQQIRGVWGPGSRAWGTPCGQSFYFPCYRCQISGRQSKQFFVPANHLKCGPDHLLSFFSVHSAKHLPCFFRKLVFPISQRLTSICACSAFPQHRESIHLQIRKTTCTPALFH